MMVKGRVTTRWCVCGWGNAYICEHTILQFINLFETGKISFLEFIEMGKGDNSLEKATNDGEGEGDNKGVCVGGKL